MLTANLAGLAAIGLLLWAVRMLARVRTQLLSFNGFEGMHLEG